ncbi:helix-turn-helix domain-containing protein [Kitasatospora sp. NBC_00240]|uniref:helix-turn-helix domain-containing protein n=1 Tax=Kitasatospora sp. NBC_00240 TaxID=2903567 RepID=UPI002255C719|nr:helix-turn-helix transcriptional regulator [Kitasatospora sp. NBC_00240]MCX5215762.1 helix-turn-helix domain-containing protein [Kitasatospora sp. NBC_00240]
MAWRPTTAALAAARAGNYGMVIREAREQQRLSQRTLAELCGTNQSTLSRQLENRGDRSYPMDLLRRVATQLEIPLRLVGLAESYAGQEGPTVQRRTFLTGAAALATAPLFQPGESGTQAAALRVTTSAFRRLDASTPARDLVESARTHLRLIHAVSAGAVPDQRRALAGVASETASFTGWLAWDMGDHGSARANYGRSIEAARASGNDLLTAYQVGSLAQFEAHSGNAPGCLTLAAKARRLLGHQAPPVADAWLYGTEALGHAIDGDADTCDEALRHSARIASTLTDDQPPPWPWVFAFDEAKVDAIRAACGARLERPSWTLANSSAILAGAHVKQRALALLDLAQAHLSVGRLDSGFALATQAVDTGLAYQSGRIVERARTVRRTVPTSTPAVVRAFDDRLHDVYL